MKALYLALIAQIKIDPEIKWIDLDSGQLDNEDKKLTYPCALIRMSFNPGDVSESSEQRESANISVRLAFDATGTRTSSQTPESAINRSLAWTEQADNIYNSLQGFEPSDFDELECTGRNQEPRNDGLVVWNMTFKTARWMFRS